MANPIASRPHMPGYGITAAAEDEGLLPWSWAVERLSRAHNYWLATGRREGGPHLTAVWGVWHDDAFYFSCASNSRKARNLSENPACAVSTEQADEAVIVEGVAERFRDIERLTRFVEAYNPKYEWDFIAADLAKSGGIFVVHPRVAFAFIEDPGQFQSSATRWTFGEG